MYGRKKISFWLLHLGLLLAVAGAIVSWQTMISDRVFLAPEGEARLHDLWLWHHNNMLLVNDRSADVERFQTREIWGWSFHLLNEMPDGTWAIEMRQDPVGEPLVFTGYLLFAVGCCGVIGMRWVMAVLALMCAMPLFKPASPALQSPWFSIHVGLIAAAYLCFLMLPWKSSQKLLTCGVCLLGMGIAAGSVWASSAWGRYWGWDPKETFALALMLLYCIPLHFRQFNRRWVYGFLLIIIFAMLFLPGLHSYIF